MVALNPVEKSPCYQASLDQLAAYLPVRKGKILVTGATGLIGSCVIDLLCRANQMGASFDIYALGRSEHRLNQRFDASKVHFVVQDIVHPLSIPDLDYILHGASNADPRSYSLYPAETILINILGARNVLDYAKEHKTRVLLMSTFEVYGKLNQDVYREDDFGLVDPNQIRSCYPESKRTAELLFRTYHEEYGTNSVIARLSSIYGPTMQQNDSKAHAQFLRSGLEGKAIVLKSEGLQNRTYCYLMDAVGGLMTVLFQGESCQAYNIANPASVTTIANLASTIADLCGTTVRFELPDAVEAKGYSKPQNCILNTNKLEQLGWHSRYDLRSGLKETLQIMREIQK